MTLPNESNSCVDCGRPLHGPLAASVCVWVDGSGREPEYALAHRGCYESRWPALAQLTDPKHKRAKFRRVVRRRRGR